MRHAVCAAATLLVAAVALQTDSFRAAAGAALECQRSAIAVDGPKGASSAAALCDVHSLKRCTDDCNIQTRNVLRSFNNVSSPWSASTTKFKLSGHVARLQPSSTVSSLSVLPPLHGCASGRGNTIPELTSAFASRRHFFVELSQPGASSRSAGVFVTSSSFGCHVATNGNLFATDSFRCHGNIVANGRVIHSGSNRVAHFGLLHDRGSAANSSSASAMLGYLSEAEGKQLDAAKEAQETAQARLRDFIRGGLQLNASELRQAVQAVWPGAVGPESAADSSASTMQPFAQLIPGLIWLVRDGSSFVATGVPQAYEDMSAQETGSAAVFVDVASARTAVGLDADGRIVIAQVDGRSDWAGLDLRSFANWLADDLHLQQAINLDGGASATWVREGAVVANVPSYSCLANGAVSPKRRVMHPQAQGARAVQAQQQAGKQAAAARDDPNFRCLRPVSAGLCMHDRPVEPPVASVRSDRAGPSKDGQLQRVIKVPDGCVCFHEAQASADAAGDGDDADVAAGYNAFTWDEAAAVFRVQIGSVGTASARQLRTEGRLWSQLLAGAGMTDPLAQTQDSLSGAGSRRATEAAELIHLWPPEPYLTLHARAAAAAWLNVLPDSLRRRVVLHSDPRCVCSGGAAAAAAGAVRDATAAHLTLHRHAFHDRLAAWHAALRKLSAAAEHSGINATHASFLAAAWPSYSGEQDEVDHPADRAFGLVPLLSPQSHHRDVRLGGVGSLSIFADRSAVTILAFAALVVAAIVLHRRRGVVPS